MKNSDTGALIVTAMLDFLTFALCTPYSETTEGRHFDSLLEMVAKRGRSLFKHFQVNIVNYFITFLLKIILIKDKLIHCMYLCII